MSFCFLLTLQCQKIYVSYKIKNTPNKIIYKTIKLTVYTFDVMNDWRLLCNLSNYTPILARKKGFDSLTYVYGNTG